MKYFSLLCAVLGLAACTSGTNTIKPASTGQYGEIFVIIDEDLFTDKLRSSLEHSLGQPQMLYGGEEPFFKLIYLTPGQAKGSLIYEGTTVVLTKSGMNSGIRKLLPEKVDSAVTRRKQEGIHTYIQKDVWSSPQQVLFLLGDNSDSLAKYIIDRRDQLLGKVLDMEREESVVRMTRLSNEKIRKEILAKHDIDVRAPISYHIASNSKINEGEGFIWMRNEDTDYDMNLVIHYQPYTDTSQFALMNLIARRDSVEKPYITGQAKGSYMATDTQFPYFLKTVDFNGHFAREYNALWTLENDFMGGPYYSVTVLDQKKNRLVTLEGFVYAPTKEKTRYLREIQGIIYGVNF